MCFASQPSPQPLPPPPKETDSDIMARQQAERQKALAAQGMGATVITGGLGASDFDNAGKRSSSGGGTKLLGQTAAAGY
jgi:hypothetical protein